MAELCITINLDNDWFRTQRGTVDQLAVATVLRNLERDVGSSGVPIARTLYDGNGNRCGMVVLEESN